MSFFKKIKRIFHPKCEQVRFLSSEALDRKLLGHESVALRIHQCMCWSCRQFKKQLAFLRETMPLYADRELHDVRDARLSEESKERLKKLRV